MAKNDIPSYDATAANNTDVQSVDISENCSPAGINNAIREVMADLKNVDTGAVALTSPQFATASMTGNLDLGDNNRIRLGSGNDLQLYHDGSDSYINDTGTGNLRLAGAAGVDIIADSGETMAKFISNGASELYHNNGKSLETTAVGVTVNGNLGIGTSSPSVRLDAKSSGEAAIGIGSTNAGGAVLYLDGDSNGDYAGTDYSYIQHDANGRLNIVQNSPSGTNQLRLYTGNTERLRINGDGRIQKGTTSAIQGEDISHQYNSNNGPGLMMNSTDTQGTTHTQVIFRRNGANVGSIQTNGASTSYNTSSDYRLKEAVTPLTNATDRLKQLNPVRFNFIVDPDTTVDGFLAHEAQAVVPESVSGSKDAMCEEQYEVTPAVLDDDGNEVTPAEMGTRTVPDFQSIDQSKLVPLLVATIQELEARIAALEA